MAWSSEFTFQEVGWLSSEDCAISAPGGKTGASPIESVGCKIRTQRVHVAI